jgi:hypothetical protein
VDVPTALFQNADLNAHDALLRLKADKYSEIAWFRRLSEAGACFASEEQLNFVKVFPRTEDGAVVGGIFSFRYVKPEIGGPACNVEMEI